MTAQSLRVLGAGSYFNVSHFCRTQLCVCCELGEGLAVALELWLFRITVLYCFGGGEIMKRVHVEAHSPDAFEAE